MTKPGLPGFGALSKGDMQHLVHILCNDVWASFSTDVFDAALGKTASLSVSSPDMRIRTTVASEPTPRGDGKRYGDISVHIVFQNAALSAPQFSVTVDSVYGEGTTVTAVTRLPADNECSHLPAIVTASMLCRKIADKIIQDGHSLEFSDLEPRIKGMIESVNFSMFVSACSRGVVPLTILKKAEPMLIARYLSEGGRMNDELLNILRGSTRAAQYILEHRLDIQDRQLELAAAAVMLSSGRER